MNIDFVKFVPTERLLESLRGKDTVMFVAFNKYVFSGIVDWEQGYGNNYFIKSDSGARYDVSDITSYAVIERIYKVKLVLILDDETTIEHMNSGHSEESAALNAWMTAPSEIKSAKPVDVIAKVYIESFDKLTDELLYSCSFVRFQ